MRKLSHITILDEFAVDMSVVLGHGSTGCVYQGLNMKNSARVAVKIIDLRAIDNQVAEYLLHMEKTAIMILNSPYVLKGLKVAQDSHYCFLVTQFCNGGTLKKFIKASPTGFLSEDMALKIVFQILLGYKSLTEKGVIHRDLKPANIMLHDETAKIIDFGYCSIQGYATPSLEYNVGSPSYMAPESFDRNVYNQKTEIWAIGVILFECVTGKTIDEGRHMTEVYQEIKMFGVPYPNHVSINVRNIINWCLSINPKTRPTCSQLLETYFGMVSPKGKSSSQKVQNGLQNGLENSIWGIYSNHKTENDRKVNTQKNYRLTLVEKQEQLFKSIRVDNKSKSYKVPQFLQASIKLASKNTNEKKQKTNKDYFNEMAQNRRVVPSKSGKISRDGVYGKENYKNWVSPSGWQYGTLSATKNQRVFSKKTLEIQDAYKRSGKTENLKERISSIQISTSPCRNLAKSPARLICNMSKEARSRMKRTFTDRFNMIRA